MQLAYFDDFARDYRAYKGGSWCYEDGLVYRGLEHLYRSTGDARWLEHLKRLIAPQLLSGPALKGYDPNDYNIDNILSGHALLYLHELDGNPQWLGYADLLIDQLQTHPRTLSGVYWHKLRYPWQVWLDGLYMGLPFQIAYGLKCGDEALIEDALKQMHIALDITYVSETGLYAHATDEARKQPWASSKTGHPKAHWARALGWLAMALVDVAALVGVDRFAPLRARTVALLTRIAEWQQPSGLWLQVIDQPELPGNWEETSATAMFTYALLRGRDLALWQGATDKLYDLLLTRALKPKEGGGMQMVEICHVAGLGMYENRFRDGSAAYYISEARICDDPKGVGPLMMATAARMNQLTSQERVFSE